MTYGARVDCDTVILIVDIRARDSNVRTVTDVKSIGVGGAFVVTGTIVNSDTAQGKIRGVVDAEDLYGRIQNVDVADSRRYHIVCVEEFRLRFPAAGPISIPPICSISVEIGA